MPFFGPAGNPQAFYDEGLKSSLLMPAWLAGKGLTAYEYQCGHGVNIGDQTAEKLGSAARENGIALSIHAPYYINLASDDSEKQIKTIGYILDSLKAARMMDARRVVLHPGSAAKATSRDEALSRARSLLSLAIREADDQNLLDTCFLCPEVMGKNNQLGDLNEVIALCHLDDRLLPCVDFGHLNARTQGGLRTADDYRTVCLKIANDLGRERLDHMHVHFSRIEFSAGGEKRHHTMADRQYGPDFEPFATVMAEMNLNPVIICESDGTQADDAILMLNVFESAKISQMP